MNVIDLIIKTTRDRRSKSDHSQAGLSAEIRKRIFEEARLLQNVDKSIPWYRLAAKYRLSIDTLQSIFDQAEVDARRRQQQSALVTSTAERHFDSKLGRCNWEAVASELDTPLIECLDLFDASNSTIQPRSLIDTYGGWSKPDVEKLKLFMTTNYADCSTIDWRLVGIYMNVDALECQRIGLGTFNYPINEVGYRRICELRDSGLSWKDVYQHFMQYPNEKSLQNRYYQFKAKPNGKTTERLTTEWTDADREQMKDLIKQHMESTARSELVNIIKRELPNRPLSDIRLLCRQYVHKPNAGRMSLDRLTQLRELVGEYGEDWDRIGKVLDVLPSMARYNWITYGGNVGNRFALSSDETRQLQHLVGSGVKYKEAAKLLGIVSPHGYYYKPTQLTSIGDTHLKSNWTSTEDETLLKMIDVSMTSTAAKWELVSKALGRSVIACKQRVSVINRGHKCEQVDYDRESIVTSEVQRQLESNSTVNWSKVSQATELGLRECLELSQYDVGKARWQYDPDLFSQDMADCMTDFIKEHYPVPAPVIYRAVSNFMWVAMDDCICIHDMLQGKFKWTEANYERATALRAKGLTWKEVARHLSPTLSLQSVYSALKIRSSSKQVREPISADELDEVSRLVDEYAGKYPVVEIFDKIHKQLHLGNRRSYSSIISSRITAHPHYQAKLRDIDYNDLANRIATGQTTTKLAAIELDVPLSVLTFRVMDLKDKLYSSTWTEKETRKLVNYVQGCDLKPDFDYFSKVLGTKSTNQCKRKTYHLWHKGVLPHIPPI
ncbi:hypothetical protein GGI14_002472 [Coemansia sp. S680]|nr:hypothetical protein GGI14_002472 [Coemansia sp. S680]